LIAFLSIDKTGVHLIVFKLHSQIKKWQLALLNMYLAVDFANR